MITTSDITNILVKDASTLGIKAYPFGNVPYGALNGERIVVIAKELQPETYWQKCFVEVNIQVPDLDSRGNANLVRLQEVQSVARVLFDDQVGEYDDSWYEYERSSDQILEDEGLRCHYVNIRVLFKVLNVK